MTPRGLLGHRVEGDGEPLLLLNGGAMSFSTWEAIAAPLRETHRVVRCDLRGQFLSPGPAPSSFASHVDDVAALLDALGIQRAHVLGTSFGAEVGLLMAGLRPDRVSSVVAVTAMDVFGDEWTPGSRLLRSACRRALAGGDRGAVFDVLLETAFSPEYRSFHEAELAARRAQIGALPFAWFAGLEGLVASLEGLDLRPVLPRITCPALVVIAEFDATMPRERSEALAATITGAEMAVVRGSGHALVAERPGELVALVQEFLSGIAGVAG
jgi:3-oxoadipate enol-lactonase